MVGIVESRLKEENLAMELDTIDVEGVRGNAERVPPSGWEGAMVRNVVQCQKRGHRRPGPMHIGRRQPAGPVIHVQDIRPPVGSGSASDLRGSK